MRLGSIGSALNCQQFVLEASLTSSSIEVVPELTKPALVVNKGVVQQKSLRDKRIWNWRAGAKAVIFKTLMLRNSQASRPQSPVTSPMIARP